MNLNNGITYSFYLAVIYICFRLTAFWGQIVDYTCGVAAG